MSPRSALCWRNWLWLTLVLLAELGHIPPLTTAPSVLFGMSVCASPFPSPSVIPFWISPGHLCCGRVLTARGFGVTMHHGGNGAIQTSAGVWRAVAAWEPGWPTIKTQCCVLGSYQGGFFQPFAQAFLWNSFPSHKSVGSAFLWDADVQTSDVCSSSAAWSRDAVARSCRVH